MSGRPPVRFYKLGSHWTELHEICQLGTFTETCPLKSVEKIEIWLRSDSNKRNLREDLCAFYCYRRQEFAQVTVQ